MTTLTQLFGKIFTRSTKAQKSTAKSRPARKQLRLESLEARELFSTTPMTPDSAGVHDSTSGYEQSAQAGGYSWPFAPSLSIQHGFGQWISIHWTRVGWVEDGESKVAFQYDLYSRHNPGDEPFIQNLGPMDDYVLRTQTYGESVQYRVVARTCHGDFDSGWHTYTQVDAPPVTPRVKVEGPHAVTLTWSARNYGDSGFVYKKIGTGPWEFEGGGGTPDQRGFYSWKVDGLPANTLVHFRVNQSRRAGVGAVGTTVAATTEPGITAELKGSNLDVWGTDKKDIILVNRFGGLYSVDNAVIKVTDAHGKVRYVESVPTSDVSRIGVWGDDENDIIRLDRSAPITIPSILYGGDGNDTIVGGEGDDRIFGQRDNDKLAGKGGDDYLEGGHGIDMFDGGDAFDTFQDDFLTDQWAADGYQLTDIAQGDSDTCVINAAMAEAAWQHVDLSNLIHFTGYDGYEVTIFGKTEEVRFDGSWDDNDSKPTQFRQGDGTLSRANNGEYWTVLYQRAYLQVCGVNYQQPLDQWGRWHWSNHDYHDHQFAIDSFTGTHSQVAALSATAPQTALTWNQELQLVTTGGTGHAYAVLGVEDRNNDGHWIVKLYNPYGKDDVHWIGGNHKFPFAHGDLANDGVIELDWTTYRSNFRRIYHGVQGT